ncbi:MAG: rhodanese-like domain-containing protein [Flavobacteriales bacterium]|nr:rhodanese-like domain-containing protein [Bacteroidota bacterium]MCB9239496.1 rhodanese-like domain-containing protein [Flavobacteriales bacterium]
MADITVSELKKRLEAGEKLNIIDVREPWEFEEFNINARLIPLGELQGSLDSISDWKDQEVIVHCKSGGRSAAACDFLSRSGFTNVRNLEGGMLAWMMS